MNASMVENSVLVSLSRRNLETLIKMLDQRVGMPSLVRRTESGIILRVRAEENDEHYGERKPGKGPEDVQERAA